MATRRRPPQPTRLGQMVRSARVERGLTQEMLGEIVGRSQEWVGKIESGEIAQPRVGILRELARALGCDPAELIIAAQVAGAEAEARRINEAVPPYRASGDAGLAEIVAAWDDLSEQDRSFVLGMVARFNRRRDT